MGLLNNAENIAHGVGLTLLKDADGDEVVALLGDGGTSVTGLLNDSRLVKGDLVLVVDVAKALVGVLNLAAGDGEDLVGHEDLVEAIDGTVEHGGADGGGLINESEADQLPCGVGLVPSADITLIGDAALDGPSVTHEGGKAANWLNGALHN